MFAAMSLNQDYYAETVQLFIALAPLTKISETDVGYFD
jgi:hypothetical protein